MHSFIHSLRREGVRGTLDGLLYQLYVFSSWIVPTKYQVNNNNRYIFKQRSRLCNEVRLSVSQSVSQSVFGYTITSLDVEYTVEYTVYI